MEVQWTWEQDEEIRALCEKGGTDPASNKLKWWDGLAASSRTLSGLSGKQLLSRWLAIRLLPGLEYKSINTSSMLSSFLDPKNSAPNKLTPGKPDPGATSPPLPLYMARAAGSLLQHGRSPLVLCAGGETRRQNKWVRAHTCATISRATRLIAPLSKPPPS